MKNKILLRAFFALTALEGVWAGFVLWSLPSGASGLLLGRSPLRLGLLALVATLVLLNLAGLARSLRRAAEQPLWLERLLERRFAVLLAGALFVTLLIGGYVFIVSPLHLARLNAYYLRFRALILWGTLVGVQLIALLWLYAGPGFWRQAWADLGAHPAVQRAARWLHGPGGGLLLLALSLLIGLTKLYFGRFVDEADNMAIGWLLSPAWAAGDGAGARLYRDVFSHHFPFVYYWVAAVVSLAGRSFALLRLSLLTLQLGLFALAMRLTGWHLALGLTALAWNLTNQFHRGQELLYATFEGLFLLAAGTLILYLLVERPRATRSLLFLIGSLLALAVISDPLMVYPSAAALLGVFVSGLQSGAATRWRAALQRAGWAILPLLLLAGWYSVWLFGRGTAGDFYHNAIWFNAEIYARYVPASPNRLPTLASNLISGLRIFSPHWYSSLSPFMPLLAEGSVKLANEHLYAGWVFAGFLFRFSILAGAAGLLLNRRAGAALFLYTFAATLLVRADEGFYTIGFTMLSLFSAAYTLLHLRRPARLFFPDARRWMAPRTIWIGMLLVLASMHFWASARGAWFLARHPVQILNPNHVWQYRRFAQNVRTTTCNQPGIELAIYPINPIAYFVTGLQPASRYLWMYPWVAEVGQQELIAELRAHESAFIWINLERGAGSDNSVAVYMSETIQFLDDEYFKLGATLWMSPELAENCPIDLEDIPFYQ